MGNSDDTWFCGTISSPEGLIYVELKASELAQAQATLDKLAKAAEGQPSLVQAMD